MEHEPVPDSMSPDNLPGQAPAVDSPAGEEGKHGSRRQFLCRSARKLAYTAPLVLLFKPKAACGSGLSQFTYWDVIEGEAKHRDNSPVNKILPLKRGSDGA